MMGGDGVPRLVRDSFHRLGGLHALIVCFVKDLDYIATPLVLGVFLGCTKMVPKRWAFVCLVYIFFFVVSSLICV